VLERAKALLDEAAALIVLTGARTYGAPLSVEQERLREWAGSRQESMTS
jgi:hypothetical protein